MSDALKATRLRYDQKLQALADKHYTFIPWVPKAGDYYTTDRADLELYRVVKIENGIVYTEYATHPGNLAEWDEEGFTTEGFGPMRTLVSSYIFDMPDPTLTRERVDDLPEKRSRKVGNQQGSEGLPCARSSDSERMEKLKEAARPLLKLLCEEYHPHHTAIVTGTSIELLEGVVSVPKIHDHVVH